MKKFLIASVNHTASTGLILSFIAFILFALKGISFYKGALISTFVCLGITLITPNEEERKKFFEEEKTKIDDQ